VKESKRVLSESYRTLLEDVLESGLATAAHRARQLGREAQARGYGPLEMAAIHQEALVSVLLARLLPADAARCARRASELFGEALQPFDSPRAVAKEPGVILANLNRELEARVQRILASLAQRQRMEKLKDEFVSVVSHELRTPMTAIHGSLDLLQSGIAGKLSTEVRSLVETAFRNSDRLVGLVNDLLDVQRLDAGELAFDVKCVSLRPLLSEALEACRPRARRLGIRLVLEPPLRGVNVRADPERLKQAVTNLLSNAVKFSPAGSAVVVSARRRRDMVRIAVTDRGPGIPDDFKARVFHKFSQADSSATRRNEGAGLGLSLAKAIVERLGGRIGFDGVPGRMTFYCEIPLWRRAARSRGADTTVERATAGRGVRRWRAS
jgi:signal transduction histidine kinase